MQKLIRKVSGTQEPFNEQKIIRSLSAIGADNDLIDQIIQQIKEQFPTITNTKQIFAIALRLLRQHNNALASRYNLKKALLAFGPAGFPFEHFVAALFEQMRYTTKTDVYLQGLCVQHEIDIIATKDDEQYMIECKFHNKQQYKSDVKIPLYMRARFEDITKKEASHMSSTVLLVTNTSFTEDAVRYARCVNMQIMSWSYPAHNNLRDLITQYKLHPITALVNVSGHRKKFFLDHGLVLCRDAEKHRDLLKAGGLSASEIDALIKEARTTCML